MSTAFDMELFLSGVLTGSHATRKRHLRQAKAIQEAIFDRWNRSNPWNWQRKHLDWFLNQHLNKHAESTRYYYLLTMNLLALRLAKPWQFIAKGEVGINGKHSVDHSIQRRNRQEMPG